MICIIIAAGPLAATERLIRMYRLCVSFNNNQRNLGLILHLQLTIYLNQHISILYGVLDQITAQLPLQKIKKKLNVEMYYSYSILYCVTSLRKAPEPVVICKWEWESDMQCREGTIMEEFKLSDTQDFSRVQAKRNEAENSICIKIAIKSIGEFIERLNKLSQMNNVSWRTNRGNRQTKNKVDLYYVCHHDKLGQKAIKTTNTKYVLNLLHGIIDSPYKYFIALLSF